MQSYPKWMYHPTKEALVVPDEAARMALGPGWVESPADAKLEPDAKSEPSVEVKPLPKKYK